MADSAVALFDPRPYQRRHEEPFAHIMKAAEVLAPGQDLILLNTFDPRPLEAVMETRGFIYQARQVGPADWQARCTRNRPPGEAPVLDNRGLSPADVSVRTLQTLRRIGNESLTVLFDADPSGFCAAIRRRGYVTSTEANSAGSYRVLVRRARSEPQPEPAAVPVSGHSGAEEGTTSYMSSAPNFTLDVRPLSPAQKHPRIRETFKSLPAGEAIPLVNDHDPNPLRFELDAERLRQFDWSCVEQGPEVWRVLIARR